jgi:hypothetical protein
MPGLTREEHNLMPDIPHELAAALGNVSVPSELVQPVVAWWSQLSDDQRQAFGSLLAQIPTERE